MEQLTKRQFIKRALLASGALVASPILAACGAAPAATPAAPAAKPAESAPAAKPAASKEVVTLRLHFRAGGEKSEPAIYVDRPTAWEQETGNKVQLDPIPGGKDYIPKVDSMAAGGTIGDALWTSDVWSEHTHLVRFKVLEPVDQYLTAKTIKKTEWFKGICDTITIDGKMYGLPKTGHPGDSYVWINLKMFEAAGIKKPEVFGTTLEQLAEWAVKLSKGPKDKRDVYGYRSAVDQVMSLSNGIRTFGGDLVAPDGTKSLLGSPEVLDWLKWNYKLIAEEKVHPLGDAVPTAGFASLFGAERLAMIHAQRSTQFQVKNAVGDKFPWMTIQFPRGPKAKGWVFCVDTHSGTAASKKKDETFSLLYAMADAKFAYGVSKTQGYLTGRTNNLEEIKEVAQDPFIQLQQKCVEQAEPFWRAKNLRVYEIESTMLNTLDSLWLDKAKPDAAFQATLTKAIDEVLSKPE
jgi:ABC-type glycerol-3-phosphate transport system substrate-binding protein